VTLNILGSRRVDREEVQTLESERVPLRMLTLDEAVHDQELRRRGIIVFRNTETDRVNVIYRRGDGNLTLIEPES
jgi:putative sigma-54 modulation protein